MFDKYLEQSRRRVLLRLTPKPAVLIFNAFVMQPALFRKRAAARLQKRARPTNPDGQGWQWWFRFRTLMVARLPTLAGSRVPNASLIFEKIIFR
jgi:hypothetical protein